MRFIKRKREVIFDEADLEIVVKTLAETIHQYPGGLYMVLGKHW